MENPLVETWLIHDRIHAYFLDAIAPEALDATIGGKGRTVRDQFGHVHDVRLMWLKSAAPDLLAGLEKVGSKSDATKEQLACALAASGAAIAEMLRRAIASGGKLKGFKPHATAFVGYLISHESHHRGQVGWTLKHSGRPLDRKTAFGLWEWGVR